MALAAGLRAGFWAYTGRTWEDALITVLHSENFYRGLGLTHFRVDESLPVHGFTSPLSVLIPLAGDWLKLGFGLTLLKLASLGAGAAAVLYVFRIFQVYPELGTELSTVVLAAGYVAVEHHQILWGMAGMETQIATTVLLASIYYCRAGSPVMLGISLGLCLLARPDFAFWVLIVGLWLAVQRSWWRLIQTAAVTALLYGPWVVFTSWYYGSPIPNTILAKSAGFGLWWRAPMTLWEFFPQLWQKSVGAVFQVLGPCFGGHGTGFRPLPGGRAIAVAMLALLLLARRQKSLGLLYALVAVYTLYYTFLVPVTFGWYTAPLAASAILLCAKGAGDLLRAQPRLAWAGAAVYLGALAWILPTTFTAERNIQQIVEEGIRAKIGRYLNEVAAPNQTIGCEPLGYIGYYSQ
ncbi:MAG: hypothetical protein HY013_07205, partial [Candidatus Solibacter usitatus]|nr:hypothetical protein [Candidatus Solibacter usitatus]